MKKYLKKIIAPIQMTLLGRGLCVGCGMPLKKAKREDISGEKEKVTCKCKRIFIFDKKNGQYKRAELNEI